MPAAGRQSAETNGLQYMSSGRPAGAMPPQIPGMRDIEDGGASGSFMDELYASTPEFAPQPRPYSPPYGPHSGQTRKSGVQLLCDSIDNESSISVRA